MFRLKQQWVEVAYIHFITIASAVCIKEWSNRCVISMGLRSGSLLFHGHVPFPHCTYYHHDHQRIHQCLKCAIWQAHCLQIHEN